MAIPENPLFTANLIASYSARLRKLALPSRVYPEIAEYLPEKLDTVKAWFFPTAWTQAQTVTKTRVVTRRYTIKKRVKALTPRSWGEDYTKAQLLTVLKRSSRSGTGITQRELAAYFKKHSSTKRADLVALAAKLTKPQVAQIFDTLRPQTEETYKTVAEVIDRDEEETYTETIPAQRLPDALTEEEYLGRLLSSFPRGQYLRKKADLVLALLGEVRQIPQDGVDEGSFRVTASSLYDAENAQIWPARCGTGFDGDPFLNEMWFRITLLPWESSWRLEVDYLRVYEAVELETSTGWPNRADLPNAPKRSAETLEERRRQKAEYESWRKAQDKKKREKAKERNKNQKGKSKK